jgi:hypothetical protein
MITTSPRPDAPTSVQPGGRPDLRASRAASWRFGSHHAALIVIGGLSIAGTLAELTILGHYKEPAQLIPYVVLVILAIALSRARHDLSAISARVLRGLGLVAVVAAIAGCGVHFSANLQLAREIDPSRHGVGFWWSGITGKIPFLAPLVLAQCGVLLIAATLRTSPTDSTD